MTRVRSTHEPPATPAPASSPDHLQPGSELGPLLRFLAFVLPVGGGLLTLSTMVEPGEPFILAAVLVGLAVPAVVLTHRESGRRGVRALLRDAVRMPRSWWWLPVAAFGLPLLSWAVAAPLDGARPPGWSLFVSYTLDLVVGVLVINLWEELAWTGFFQRRAMARWGASGGSLVTAVFFTGFHVPLAVDGARGVVEGATNTLLVGVVAIGFRLLVGRVDVWSGRSLLTVAVLHSSFNATEAVLAPGYDWVRLVVTIAAGVTVVALRPRDRSTRTRA